MLLATRHKQTHPTLTPAITVDRHSGILTMHLLYDRDYSLSSTVDKQCDTSASVTRSRNCKTVQASAKVTIDRMWIATPMQSIEWCHFQWPHNPGVKVLFKGEYMSQISRSQICQKRCKIQPSIKWCHWVSKWQYSNVSKQWILHCPTVDNSFTWPLVK